MIEYSSQGVEQQKAALVRIVLQRRRLDGDSEGMEERVGRREG